MKRLLVLLALTSCTYPTPTVRTAKNVGVWEEGYTTDHAEIDRKLTEVCKCAHVGAWECYSTFSVKIRPPEVISGYGACTKRGWKECAGTADFDRDEVIVTPDLAALGHEAGHFYDLIQRGRKYANGHHPCAASVYCGNAIDAGKPTPDIDDCVPPGKEGEDK